MTNANIQKANETISKLKAGIEQVIRGKTDTCNLLLTALVADGHVLLEDLPGSGKTTITKTLGNLIASDLPADKGIASYRRIQFTPDMLPGDVLGVNIFEPSTGQFRFASGPVFAHIVLADEINRTSPKVQAAFLECMAEKQVTIDGKTYLLDDLFFVVGTQNPIDIAGTYPLPIVQLDRFLLKLPMHYADANTEMEIMKEADVISKNLKEIKPVVERTDILDARMASKTIYLHPAIQETAVAIAQASRQHPATMYGISTRALIMFQAALKAHALVLGQDYVSEDNVKTLLEPTFLHRIKFHPGSGKSSELLAEIAEPHLEKLIKTRLNQEA